jgi:predicted AAA+ superfamily ATPase
MGYPSHLYPRLLEPALLDRLGRSPVVVVTGARQVGKTTLVRSLPRRFLTLDSLTTLDQARREPEALVEAPEPITVDEVQRAPDLLIAIKRSVDADRRRGRFLLTGSSDLLLRRDVGESLAGRAVYLVLRPLTEREKRKEPPAPAWGKLLEADSPEAALHALVPPRPLDWRTAALVGGFPPAALASEGDERHLWFDGYVDTYVQKDLRDLAQVGDLAAFVRLMRLAALRTGGLLNQAELARDASVSRTSAQRWLSILEVSFLLTLLPAFAASRAKRLIKAPKLYAGDTGLALHLRGVHEAEALGREPNAGVWLENLVLNDLLAWRETEIIKPGLFFRRTVTGEEVDLVLERGKRLLPIEVKAARNVRVSDARALDALCAEFPRRAPCALLLYDGRDALRLTKTTVAAPLGSVL